MLSTSPRGVILDIRAAPRAGRSGIAGVRAGALLVRLAAAPVDGAANDELIAVLASAFDLPKRRISVISGERGRDKRVMIEGASLAEIQGRLTGIIPR